VRLSTDRISTPSLPRAPFDSSWSACALLHKVSLFLPRRVKHSVVTVFGVFSATAVSSFPLDFLPPPPRPSVFSSMGEGFYFTQVHFGGSEFLCDCGFPLNVPTVSTSPAGSPSTFSPFWLESFSEHGFPLEGSFILKRTRAVPLSPPVNELSSAPLCPSFYPIATFGVCLYLVVISYAPAAFPSGGDTNLNVARGSVPREWLADVHLMHFFLFDLHAKSLSLFAFVKRRHVRSMPGEARQQPSQMC